MVPPQEAASVLPDVVGGYNFNLPAKTKCAKQCCPRKQSQELTSAVATDRAGSAINQATLIECATLSVVVVVVAVATTVLITSA